MLFFLGRQLAAWIELLVLVEKNSFSQFIMSKESDLMLLCLSICMQCIYGGETSFRLTSIIQTKILTSNIRFLSYVVILYRDRYTTSMYIWTHANEREEYPNSCALHAHPLESWILPNAHANDGSCACTHLIWHFFDESMGMLRQERIHACCYVITCFV